MTNIDKLYNFVKSRKFQTEADVRNYFKDRIKEPGLLDEIILHLVKDKLITPTPSSEPKPDATVSISPYKEVYRKAVAQFFRIRQPLARPAMKMEMAFKLKWFVPEDADNFIGFLLRDKLIEERDGKLYPTFDVNEIEVPLDWSIHDELKIKTGEQVAIDQMKERERKAEEHFLEGERKVDEEKEMAEDGIEKTDVVFDEKPDMTESDRNAIKDKTIKRLSIIGMPARVASFMFDYYELNFGLADLQMFTVASAQHTNFSDQDVLKKAYNILVEVLH